MTMPTKPSKISLRDGYVVCPVCDSKVQRILPNTSAVNLPIYCRRCKLQHVVNIEADRALEARTAAAEPYEA